MSESKARLAEEIRAVRAERDEARQLVLRLLDALPADDNGTPGWPRHLPMPSWVIYARF